MKGRHVRNSRSKVYSPTAEAPRCVDGPSPDIESHASHRQES